MGLKLLFLILLAICPCLGLVVPFNSDEQIDEITDFQTSLPQNDINNLVPSNNEDGNLIATDQTESSSTTDTTDDLNQNNPIGGSGLDGQIKFLSANDINGDSSGNGQEYSSTNTQSGESGTIIQPQALNTNNQPEDSDPGFFPPNLDTTVIRIQDEKGIRKVAYSTTPDGYAVINGDVIYGTVEDLLAHQVSDDFNPGLKARAFSVPPAAAWPNGIISYKFDSNVGEKAMKDVVDAAISHWLAKAPFLTFKQVRPNSPKTEAEVLTISTIPCSNSNAMTGHAHKTQLMHLQRSCNRPNAEYPGRVQDATHEFGHTLGLQHEHERPDREQYVHFHCENLDPQCTTMPPGTTCCDHPDNTTPLPNANPNPPEIPDGCCPHLYEFQHYDPDTKYDYSGPYDYYSLMHYRRGAYGRPGKDTLVALDPKVKIRFANGLMPTSTDYHRICKLYGGECKE